MSIRIFGLLNQLKRRAAFLLFSVFLLSVQSQTVHAGGAESSSPYFIEGYDVVSYFRDSGPLEGNPSFSTKYENHTLIFSSEKNLTAFKENPESYMPAYNGYCAYGMVYGMKSKVDPLQYDVVDGRLYLQLDGGTKKRWNRRVGRNIRKSDKIWKKLSAPSEERR